MDFLNMVSIGVSLALALSGIIGSFYVAQYQIKRNKEDSDKADVEQNSEIKAIKLTVTELSKEHRAKVDEDVAEIHKRIDTTFKKYEQLKDADNKKHEESKIAVTEVNSEIRNIKEQYLTQITANKDFATKEELRDLRKETNEKLEKNYQEIVKVEKKLDNTLDIIRDIKDEIRDSNTTNNTILKEIMSRKDLTS
jgi:hypothetical protein